jgi:hypothetical protein
MVAGKRLAPSPSIEELRRRFDADLAAVPTKARRLAHPEHVRVRHSSDLIALTRETSEDALERAGLEPRSSD